MQISLKRIRAIFLKDLKEMQRNSYSISTLLLPLIFVFLITLIEEPGFELGLLPINLSLLIVGTFIQAAMIAEEKEKNTLRGLLLSPANPYEILIGKSLLSVLSATFIMIISMVVLDYRVSSPMIFVISIGLSLVIYISIGTLLGLISRSVMETSIIGIPLLFLFGMSFLIEIISDNAMLIKILSYLPNEQLDTIWLHLGHGESISGIFGNVFILLIWAIISIMVSLFIYQRQRFD